MLVPKQRLHNSNIYGNIVCTIKYYVWDTEKKDYVENSTFSFYDTKEECQEAIDWFNSLAVIKVS